MWETCIRSLGWEDPLEKGKATHFQYSGLENSMDSIVHGVTKSWTGLSDFHFHFHLQELRKFLLKAIKKKKKQGLKDYFENEA